MVRLAIALGLVFVLPAQPGTASISSTSDSSVDWAAVMRQSGLFLGIQHSFRIGTEPASRGNLRGPFVRDYLKSARGLKGWEDGDPPIVNYVGHPMMGAVSGYIFVHNHRDGQRQVFGMNRAYWSSRLKATAFATAYSVQFEFGPISESSIGNVGIDGKGHGKVDLVVTPTLGLAWQVTEDALDRFVVAKMEKRFKNRVARLALRSALNPSRSFSNALRFKVPWHRDTREPGVSGW